MLLADLARTSRELAATTARSKKRDLLAELFAALTPDEAPLVVSYLSGRLPQRRIGVGWASFQEPPPPAATPTIGVRELHETFDRIAAVAGQGAQGERRRLLHGLLAAATEEEQRFLFGLLGGELRQGALDALAAEGLAAATGVTPEAVRRAVMLAGRLDVVARALIADGAAALDTFRLDVGRPVLPMLAKTAKDVDEALDVVGPCAVEEKLDGIRVQVHRDGDEVRIFTRTLDEITPRLPEVVAAARELTSTRAVLDGEVIAFDETGRPRAFQDIAARAARREAPPSEAEAEDVRASAADLPLLPVFFDLLSLDGRDLLDLPARERHAELARITPESRRVRRFVVEDPENPELREGAREFTEHTLARGHEGVVVKGLDAPYSAGRRGASWVKVKPVHTLDLVVLAAEWGHGRRTGKLSNLHLGARRADGSFAMLGKTFKGLTDALLDWQTQRLQELALPDQADGEAAWVVRVRPELVVEVAFDGVQRSPRYPEGVTLRFARVLRYREDKPAAEADTVETVRGLLH